MIRLYWYWGSPTLTEGVWLRWTGVGVELGTLRRFVGVVSR